MLKIFLGLFLASCGYQLFATWCASRFSQRREGEVPVRLRFCQVKPVRSPEVVTLDALDAFWANTSQPHHDFYLCSTAAPPVEWLGERPHFTWLKVTASQSRNGKAASLAGAQEYWSGDVFIVSDADMKCSAGYLEAVLGEFRDSEVGVVTSLYRADCSSTGPGTSFEALCILDFSSSVLVAERTEGIKFAMGSTMAIRREVLEEIGGFEALEPYLADDFQLGFRAAAAGWKVRLAPTIMETGLGRPTFREAVSHQYRWMVTSRVSRPGGHFAFIITQGLVWAVLAACVCPWIGGWLLAIWSAVRIVCGSLQSWHLRTPSVQRVPWLALFLPLKDAIFLALWVTSLFGSKVRWGELDVEIDKDGKIKAGLAVSDR